MKCILIVVESYISCMFVYKLHMQKILKNMLHFLFLTLCVEITFLFTGIVYFKNNVYDFSFIDKQNISRFCRVYILVTSIH